MDILTAEHTQEEIEEADFQQVAVPQNLMVFPNGCTRGEAVAHMAKSIPTNEYGLPLFYIRTDLMDIAAAAHHGCISQDEADSAAELLNYQDGYPTFMTGSPFWTQMPHEPYQAFTLFQRFLDLAETEGIRLIDSLARMEQVELSQVREHHAEFFWSARARAYDLFVVAADAKKREIRTRRAENDHFTVAGTLLDAIIKRFNSDPELIEKMEASELLDAFEKMVKIQRLSLGLVGQNASSTNKELAAPAQSVEVILRQLTKNGGLESQSADNISNRLSLLMADQATALNVQELIVRATGAGDR